MSSTEPMPCRERPDSRRFSFPPPAVSCAGVLFLMNRRISDYLSASNACVQTFNFTSQEMNMKTIEFLFGSLLALVAATAYAQAGSEPCKADFEKYCPGVKPGGGAVNAWVKEHASKFSPACKQALAVLASFPRPCR